MQARNLLAFEGYMKKTNVRQTVTRMPTPPTNTNNTMEVFTMFINGRMQDDIIFHTELHCQCKIFLEQESRQLKDSCAVWLEGLAGSDYC